MDFYTIVNELAQQDAGRVVFLPFACMVLDMITGSVNAWSKGEFKSSKMRSGITKKVAEIALLIVGGLATFAGLPAYVLTFLECYVILMELISLCENINKMGFTLPAFISKGLEEAKQQAEEKPETTEKGE